MLSKTAFATRSCAATPRSATSWRIDMSTNTLRPAPPDQAERAREQPGDVTPAQARCILYEVLDRPNVAKTSVSGSESSMVATAQVVRSGGLEPCEDEPTTT
jgi:hypothetical protein